MQIRKWMTALYWRAFILCLSLKWIAKFNLGDLVWYAGKQWTLSQGVKSPVWTLRRGVDSAEAHESEFRKVRRIANYWHSFRSGWRFYMGYWYEIWKREGIQDWMRSTKIGL